MKIVTNNKLALSRLAIGAVAIGALAFGAMAIGALAIGHLGIRRGRIMNLEIGEHTIDRLSVKNQ